ncbi:MAG: PDZ domain-containing protein [Planctomycetota bacterium]|nr:MAG: PDZ domain-containing protein [Planctomycetota bacterium]REJ96108.1 MAG: PDZ domain-containing protein [Planctomycetota bacterium]REK21880.1 MAG: PDZ domain-containing protein [Planctomycetota bacterium]REK46688.1 MAG: PDZ domain-containing protein [Planctomycetota bacterium]
MHLIAATSWFADWSNWYGLFMAILGLGFVIFVHELGHFLVAKACGVKCEKFYVGFDVPIKLGWGKWAIPLPASLWKKQWGETVYGIGIIPLGGYVKMLGQDDNPARYREMQERSRMKQQADADAVDTDAASETAATAEQSTASGQASPDAPQPSGEDSPADEFALDPRSYMAKSVPARMAIISAGVIMNLIFAVIFAATAYYFGAPYTPTYIGGTTPGSPAWVENLPLGAKIIQIGADGRRSEHLRYGMDLRQTVALWDAGKPLDLVVRDRDGNEQKFAVTPHVVEIEGEGKISQIGVGSSLQVRLAARDPIPADLPVSAADATPAFAPADLIKQIVVGETVYPIEAFADLRSVRAAHVDDELVYVVEREVATEDGGEPASPATDGEADEEVPTELVRITVAPRKRRMLGFAITAGPIVAIRKDSPAERAGLQVGDVIKQVNGQEIDDPLTLPDVLRRLAGETVTLSVERRVKKETEILQIDVAAETPRAYSVTPAFDKPIGVEAIGVAIEPVNIVAKTVPGTAAAEHLRPGDELLQVEMVGATEAAQKKLDARRSEPLDFAKPGLNWVLADIALQSSPRDTNVRILFRRDGGDVTVELEPQLSDEWHLPNRGIVLTELEHIHYADGVLDAFALGLRQTREDALRVFVFLRKLVTGRISPNLLGGPITIGAVATSEASRDFCRLLLFLTLLSANLAVINFMPIPVLDGGHMVFLILEAIFRRPVSERIVIPLTYLGLFLILGLMVFVFGRDIQRFMF